MQIPSSFNFENTRPLSDQEECKYNVATCLVPSDKDRGPLTQKAIELMKIYRQCIINKNFVPDDIDDAAAIVADWDSMTDDHSLDLQEIFCCSLNDVEIIDFIKQYEKKHGLD